jgi:S1-C subfamily serine protease
MKNFAYALLVSISALSVVPALALDTNKLADVAKASIQLNENCSGQIVFSDRDKDTGDVKTLILTAAHCVDDRMDRISDVDVPVYDEDNRLVKLERYKADVNGKYYKADLALLELKDKDTLFKNVVKLAPEDVSISFGSDVVTIGYTFGQSITATPGVFGQRESIEFPSKTKSTEYFRATPSIAGGNSGGGLYRILPDGTMELIGVASAVAGDQPSTVGYYTPVDAIREYLKVAEPKAIADANKVDKEP